MGYIVSRFFLRKPVTAFLVMLSIVFFGIVSISSFKYELMPEISMPMYAVATVYPGGQPEDIDNLVTHKLEEELYNLQGAKHLQGVSRENLSIVAVQYNYGQNMDKAYNDLKKAVDKVANDFEDNVEDPMIFEMDVSSLPIIKIAVKHKTKHDLYNYVENTLVKEIERINEVSSVDVTGGQEDYVKISLKPEMMERYNLSMSTLKQIIANADFSYPGGTAKVGDRDLSFTAGVEYNTVESLKSIPIITGNKRTLYLEDIADVYEAKKKKTAVSRYDGDECIVVSIQKTQSASTVTAANNIKKLVDKLSKEDKDLELTIIEDSSNNIKNSIRSVFETMIIAIVLSMLIIWLFLGDLKASFIVGTSIPFSILTSFVGMYLAGYTLNVVTLSALVLGVGMMVDNSIVTLEACFRASDKYEGKKKIIYYCMAALEATRTIGASVLGSTITTVVVFAPLGFISGMAGQFFAPLGFTIVFCMLASYVSAISVVPLLYVLIRPKEKQESPAGGFVRSLQTLYRNTLPTILKFRWVTIVISVAMLAGTVMLLGTFKTELVAEADGGMVKFSITTKPGLNLTAQDRIYKRFEKFVASEPVVRDYVLSNSASSMSMSNSGGGQALIAYLVDKKERDESTKEIISRWKAHFADVTDCTLDITSYSTAATSMFVMPGSDKFEILLQSTDYKRLKDANDRIVKQLEKRKDCGNITSTLDNAAPLVKAEVDPILAASEGFTPASVGGLLNNMLSGVEIMDMTIDGETKKVKLEYDETEYDTVEKISNISLVSASGQKAMLKDIAKIGYHDNPQGIPKYDKMYRTTITTFFNENATENTKDEIQKTIVEPAYNRFIEKAENALDTMLGEEFRSLFIAISVAIFLVFVVMASQFESVKYSLMVMGTVLFSFAGGIFALWLANLKLAMVVLLGILMLIGTAVNNGILYVDTVNQFLEDGKDLEWSLVEAGAIRLRPILMTTLTTIVSMIPMAMAYGDNGEVLQGLAVVDIGGLVSSTIMALFILPAYYYIFSSKKRGSLQILTMVSKDAIANSEEEVRQKALENAKRRANEKL